MLRRSLCAQGTFPGRRKVRSRGIGGNAPQCDGVSLTTGVVKGDVEGGLVSEIVLAGQGKGNTRDGRLREILC